jgi:hypothetical protein
MGKDKGDFSVNLALFLSEKETKWNPFLVYKTRGVFWSGWPFRHYISTTIDGSRRKHPPLSCLAPYQKGLLTSTYVRPVIIFFTWLWLEMKCELAINNVLLQLP